MPRLIAAVYQDRSQADRALQALITSGVVRDRIEIIGAERHPSTELAPTRERSPRREPAALYALGLPDQDVRTFVDALARGYVVVSARLDDVGDADRAISTLEMFDPVDLDGRSERGMRGQAGGAAPLGEGLTAGSGRGLSNASAVPGMGALVDDTSALGSADLTTGGGARQGGAGTTATGGRAADARADQPGVGELGLHRAGSAAAPGSTAASRWREMARIGRIRSWQGS